MKPNEQLLLSKLAAAHGGPYNPNRADAVDRIAHRHGINEKRALYLCEKWEARGWWEYGISIRSGWFTPEGYEYAKGTKGL